MRGASRRNQPFDVLQSLVGLRNSAQPAQRISALQPAEDFRVGDAVAFRSPQGVLCIPQ